MGERTREMNEFIRQLRLTKEALYLDKNRLIEYEDGIINIEQLLAEMKKNNRMREIEVDIEEFTKWVHSLGW